MTWAACQRRSVAVYLLQAASTSDHAGIWTRACTHHNGLCSADVPQLVGQADLRKRQRHSMAPPSLDVRIVVPTVDVPGAVLDGVGFRQKRRCGALRCVGA